MKFARLDWHRGFDRANAVVEAWIARIDPRGWDKSCGTSWPNKDLLGHLAAWSDLLTAQVEALRDGRPGAIEAVDVDRWNAAQVASRRGQLPKRTVYDWRCSMQKLDRLVRSLPPEVRGRTWPVRWTDEQVSIDDLLRLWLLHVEQHRARLDAANGGAVRRWSS